MTKKTRNFTGTLNSLNSRSIDSGLRMGLISQIPVREGLAASMRPNHLRNPYDLLQIAVEDNNKTRHYTIGPHSKQHLFGGDI
jgi:hypothetical protein